MESDGLKHECSRASRSQLRITLACALVAAGWVSVLSGCAVRQLKLNVRVLPSANSNTPIAVDIVQVSSPRLAKELSRLSAADWFQKRAEFCRDNPEPGVLDVISREWVPGQTTSPITIKLPFALPGLAVSIPGISRKPPAIFVFANYATPGPHRAQLQAERTYSLELGVDDMTIKVGGD